MRSEGQRRNRPPFRERRELLTAKGARFRLMGELFTRKYVRDRVSSPFFCVRSVLFRPKKTYFGDRSTYFRRKRTRSCEKDARFRRKSVLSSEKCACFCERGALLRWKYVFSRPKYGRLCRKSMRVGRKKTRFSRKHVLFNVKNTYFSPKCGRLRRTSTRFTERRARFTAQAELEWQTVSGERVSRTKISLTGLLVLLSGCNAQSVTSAGSGADGAVDGEPSPDVRNGDASFDASSRMEWVCGQTVNEVCCPGGECVDSWQAGQRCGSWGRTNGVQIWSTPCGGYYATFVSNVDVATVYLYDAASGGLVAILSSAGGPSPTITCLAGPASFGLPSDCLDPSLTPLTPCSAGGSPFDSGCPTGALDGGGSDM